MNSYALVVYIVVIGVVQINNGEWYDKSWYPRSNEQFDADFPAFFESQPAFSMLSMRVRPTSHIYTPGNNTRMDHLPSGWLGAEFLGVYMSKVNLDPKCGINNA